MALESTVRKRLTADLETKEAITQTGEESDVPAIASAQWTLLEDEKYCPLVIGHHTDRGYVITAVAVLRIDPGRVFRFPEKTIGVISRSFLKSGDVSLFYSPD